MAAALLFDAAELIDFSPWLPGLFAAVFLTIVLSGAQYVWVWSRKAAAARRAV